MDPPDEVIAAPPQLQTRTRRSRRCSLVERALHFTVCYAILSLLKLVSIARNSVPNDSIINNDLPRQEERPLKSISSLGAPQQRNKKSPSIQNHQPQPLFCGEKQYKSLGVSCNERLKFLCSRYHISEQEAKNHLLENKDCICDCLWGYREECYSSLLESKDCICDMEEEDMMFGAPVKKRWVDGRWERMLIGIFSYDNLNEFELRMANRETHLNYFKRIAGGSDDDNTICSLQEILGNQTLIADERQCRIVYTFVMGGGTRNDNLRLKNGRGLDLGSINKTVKTRCLWQDPECGGTDIDEWTVDTPQFDATIHLQEEMKMNKDITFLSISENHELGKTDTWFTYSAMLTKRRPDLGIRFTAKLDSDNFLSYYALQSYMKQHKQLFGDKQYIYGGFVIYKAVCSGRAYGFVCRDPGFIAPLFMGGAFTYLSTPLAQHVYLNGTSLERKKQVWIPREDMQLGNMAYSDPSIAVEIVTHNKYPLFLNKHCFGNPVDYRREFAKQFVDWGTNTSEDKEMKKAQKLTFAV